MMSRPNESKRPTILFTAAMIVVFLSQPQLGRAQAKQPLDKASPFTAVNWEEEQPVVMFENQWYDLLGIDQLKTEDIIAFAKKKYKDRWKKRFSEDLVEVLESMGHQPEVKVQLTLKQDGHTYEKTGEMTKENRRKVWQYNQSQTEQKATRSTKLSVRGEPLPEKQPASIETGSQSGLALRMGQWIDRQWDQKPSDGSANLRFLFKKDGKPFAGKISIQGEFTFRASGRLTHVQAFNPNSNGRWIYEELKPGTYDVSIEGSDRFKGWKWSKESIQVAAGESPLFEIELER